MECVRAATAALSAASVAPLREATAAPPNKPRLRRFGAAMQFRSVSNSDGDEATDRFQDDVIYAKKVELLPSRAAPFESGQWHGDVRQEGERQICGQHGVTQPARHVAQQGREVPVSHTCFPPRC